MIPRRKVRLRHVETKEELEEATATDMRIEVDVPVVEEEEEPKLTGVRLKHAPSEYEEDERTTKYKNRSEVLGDAVDKLLALSDEDETKTKTKI